MTIDTSISVFTENGTMTTNVDGATYLSTLAKYPDKGNLFYVKELMRDGWRCPNLTAAHFFAQDNTNVEWMVRYAHDNEVPLVVQFNPVQATNWIATKAPDSWKYELHEGGNSSTYVISLKSNEGVVSVRLFSELYSWVSGKASYFAPLETDWEQEFYLFAQTEQATWSDLGAGEESFEEWEESNLSRENEIPISDPVLIIDPMRMGTIAAYWFKEVDLPEVE